jgi:phosphatidylinositol alpha-1,6-mannosyltransferase
LRVLIATFDPPENVGGVEGRAGAYTRGLAKENHFVDLIALAPHYDYSQTKFQGAILHKYPSSSRHAFRSFRSAVGEMSSNSIDSVFLLSGALTIFGLLTLLFARMTGRRSLIFLYGKDILGARGSRLEGILLILASHLSLRVAVNSRYTARLLPAFLAKKTGVLYPGVDPSIASGVIGGLQDGGDTKTILFVGRLVERKGADDLIRAFSDLDGENGKARLEIVGDGPEMSRLQELAKELGVKDRTLFFGTLTGQRLYERFANAYVFAMPSKTAKDDVEGFGTVFLEAALFGKPSIGTRSGGIPEAIQDDETGILVPEHDPRALSEALKELISDETKTLRLGRNARQLVSSKFTWDASTQALVQLLGVPGY